MPGRQEYREQVERIIRLRNLTDGTIRDYLFMCNRFLDWCESINVSPQEITVEQVQRYILNLKDVIGYSPKTINSNISFVRLFFNYVLYRPLDRYMLPYQRVDLKEPEILSKEEIVQFINALPNLKAKAMVTLLYSCGLRSAEVVGLKYSDISRERKTVYIAHTKNRTARYVPLSNTALEVLTVYWINCGKPRNWLFPGTKPDAHIKKYLGRYTHRVAISNQRIVSYDDCSVTFRYKDYHDGNKIKEMTLTTEEFTRRYLLHVLPEGFRKVRFYGLLANRSKRANLELLRRLLKCTARSDRFKGVSTENLLKILFGSRYCSGPRCPNCGSDNTTVDLAILQYFCEDCGYRWEM